MRLPILYALTYPERIASELNFSLSDLRHLDFCPPDMEKFPCLRLAYEAARAGGGKTVALNAADEVAVSAFLEGSIRFQEIPVLIEEVVSETPVGKLESIRQVLDVDQKARARARDKVAAMTGQRPQITSRCGDARKLTTIYESIFYFAFLFCHCDWLHGFDP